MDYNNNLSFPSAFYQQFIDKNGKPLAGGKLYTYIAGSSTSAVTYKTIGGGTESANMNTNPIILDMSGMAKLVISTDTAYKFILFDKNNVKIDEWDNVTAGGSAGGSSNVYVEGTDGEIDVQEESVGLVRRFIISLSDSVKNAISDLSNALSSKKDKQQASSYSGSATKTITELSQDENGELTATFEDIEGQIVYVTTSMSYNEIKAIFDAGNIPVVKDGVNLYYPTHKFEMGTNDAYIFISFPTGWIYTGDQGELKFKLLECNPDTGWSVYKNDSIYNAALIDAELEKKQNILGWAVVNIPAQVQDEYVKVCELNSPTGQKDTYYTEFSVACGEQMMAGSIPHCVESGVFEIQARCHTEAHAKARWSKYKSDSNMIYGSIIKEAAVVINGTKVEVWLRLNSSNNDNRLFIKATANSNKYGSVAFKYSNDVVNASATQYDTTHTLYTYPTISSQESVTIDLPQFSFNQAAVYTAIDAAWKEGKPIFVYDSIPPIGDPSVKYYITHRDGDDFYGISYDPTNNIDSIKLAYSSSTWTITRNLGLVNTAIENKILTIYQATINSGTDAEKDALNEKMYEVAYNGGIIIFYSNNNEAYILTQFSSNEYNFTLSQNASSTSFNSDTFNIQYSTTTHSFSATESSINIDQNDVIYRIDGNNNWIFANAANFCNHLDDAIAAKRPIEYFYTSGSVTNHYVYSDRLVGTGYKTYSFQRTYKSSASLLIVEVVELQYDETTNNITKTTTKCGVSYTAVT